MIIESIQCTVYNVLYQYRVHGAVVFEYNYTSLYPILPLILQINTWLYASDNYSC